MTMIKQNFTNLLLIFVLVFLGANYWMVSKNYQATRELQARVSQVETKMDVTDKQILDHLSNSIETKVGQSLADFQSSSDALYEEFKKQTTQAGAKMQQMVDQAIADLKPKAEQASQEFGKTATEMEKTVKEKAVETEQKLRETGENLVDSVNQEIDKLQDKSKTA